MSNERIPGHGADCCDPEKVKRWYHQNPGSAICLCGHSERFHDDWPELPTGDEAGNENASHCRTSTCRCPWFRDVDDATPDIKEVKP